MAAVQVLQGDTEAQAMNTYDDIPFLPFGEDEDDASRHEPSLGEASLEELKAQAPDVPECIPFSMKQNEPDEGSFVRTPLQKPGDSQPYMSLYDKEAYMNQEVLAEDFEATYGAYGSHEQYGIAEQYHSMNDEALLSNRSSAAFVNPKWCSSYSGQAFVPGSVSFDGFDDYGEEAPYAGDAAPQLWREDAPGLYQIPYLPNKYNAAQPPFARNYLPQQKAAGPQPNWMRTPGSEGHEKGVCRPCHYIRAKDGCIKGANCDHCHLAHRKAMPPKLHPATRRRCLTLVQRVFDTEHFNDRRNKAKQRLDEFLEQNEDLRGYAHSVMKSLKGGAVLRSISMKL